MPQINNEVAKVQEMLKTAGIVETLANDVEILDERTTRQAEEIGVVQDAVYSISSGNIVAGKAKQDEEGNVIHKTYFQGGMRTFTSDVELNNSVSKGVYHSSSLGLIVCFFESDTVTPAYQLWFKTDRQEPLIRYWDDLDKTYNFWIPYFAVDLLTEQEFDAIQSEWDGGTYWVGEQLDYYVAWIYPHNFNLCRMRIKNGVLEESTLVNGTEWTPWRNKNDNSPLILSLKQDTITKKYQIVNSNGEQVLFDEIYTEAQSRPVYCHAKDGQSLLPLSLLESSMIMFIGMPYGAGQTDYCEIQYDGEYGIISVHQRPLIVPEMNDNLDEETYLGSAPSLKYLEQYVRDNSSSAWEDLHVSGNPGQPIRYHSILDNLQGGSIYRLVVPNSQDSSWPGYGWLFTVYMDNGEHNFGQVLIDLDGQILSRYKAGVNWTEWKLISNGGNSGITVDTEVDALSNNPVANSAITKYVNNLEQYVKDDSFQPYSALYADTAYTAISDTMGNVIYETYATKEELSIKNLGFIDESSLDNLLEPGVYLYSFEKIELNSRDTLYEILINEDLQSSAHNFITQRKLLSKERRSREYFTTEDIIEHWNDWTSWEIDEDKVLLNWTSDVKLGYSFVPKASSAERSTHDALGNIIHETYATKQDIGDIETALDNIIAIQNGILGVSE